MRDNVHKLVQRVYDPVREKYIRKYDVELVFGHEGLLLCIAALLRTAASLCTMGGMNDVILYGRGLKKQWFVVPYREPLSDVWEENSPE